MAYAFDAKSINDCPVLLRPRVAEFVRLFDAGLIPNPVQPKEQTVEHN